MLIAPAPNPMPTGNLLISVVMPCYNAAPYLTEAVESALRQSYSNVELILIDDTLRTMIHDGVGEHELERYARKFTPSIRDDGLARVLKGETTIEEVLRVTRED